MSLDQTRDSASVFDMRGINSAAALDAPHATSSALEHAENGAAQSSIVSLGPLAASIAHEVTQPLSGITTNAGTCLRMLMTDPPDIDGAREALDRLLRDSRRASDVIARLRALFTRKDIKSEVVNLNESVLEVIALCWNEIQRNNTLLISELSEDLPTVIGDQVQLQQVILNLVRNALEAMLDVDGRPRQLTIRTSRDSDDCARLTIRDSGTGFGERGMDRLFRAFFTTKHNGMGIGLSVSRSIVESHGGRLWAEQNNTHGATFSFSIPIRQLSLDSDGPNEESCADPSGCGRR